MKTFTGLNRIEQVKSYFSSGDIYNRGFIKVLNRKATGFDTRAKNWKGQEGSNSYDLVLFWLINIQLHLRVAYKMVWLVVMKMSGLL